MKVGASSGDMVMEVVLHSAPGIVSIPLNNAAEILSCGLHEGRVVLFVLVKDKDNYQRGKRTFFIQPLEKELPIENWKYYFYVGMIVKKGWAVFELI